MERRQVHRRIIQIVDHRQFVRRLHVVDVGNVEGAAALVGRILLPVEILLHSFGIERRAVLELDAGPQLEGPGLEIVRVRPGQRELRLRLALVVEGGERIEDRGSRGFRRGIEHADLQGIEAGNIQFLADGDAAALIFAR